MLGKGLNPMLDDRPAGAGVGRGHVVLGEVAHVGVGDRPAQSQFADLDRGARVADPGCRAQQDRGVEAFGQVEGRTHEVVGILAVGRVEAGHPGPAGEESVVLLVLGGVQRRVIRRDDDEPGLDAGHRHRPERVHGDVESDVLHRREGPAPGDSRANGDIECDLLVR